MTKKGKRASDGAGRTDSSRRRPASSAVPNCKANMVYACRVFGPPILPPPRSDGKKRVELHLISKRVYQETILSIDGLLSARECAAWISYGEDMGFERTFHAQTAEMAHRDNGRITLHSPAVAAAVFARVGPFVPAEMDGRSAVGCNANIRIYRYSVGQRFGKHVDESVEDENRHVSYWTVLMYLNGGAGGSAATDGRDTGSGTDDTLEPLRGGETVFYKSNYGGKIAASFSPTMGACLIHGHGRRCLLHEGAVVIAGAKYVLRTDVMYA